MLATSKLEEYMLPCLNKKLFGIECMGCGLQRSLSLILHGEFIAAFKMYPAIYTLVLLAAVVITNTIKPFKQGYKLIVILGVLSTLIMITSFFLKIFLIK
ncbi:MAG: DUF2752 domain-containing protein [Jejuia sp.]